MDALLAAVDAAQGVEGPVGGGGEQGVAAADVQDVVGGSGGGVGGGLGFGARRGRGRPATQSTLGPAHADVVCLSAMASASSRTARPSATSAAVIVHGGTTCRRWKLAKGSTPPASSAAVSSFIAGLVPP